MKTKKILSEVEKKITPPKSEVDSINKTLEEFHKKLKPQLKKYKARFFVGGSLAKQTLVKRDTPYDIDIFIMFPYTKHKEQSFKLSHILEKILKTSKIKCVVLKGSRDYFQCKFKSLTLEIIPILGINKAEQAQNITDISPLHVTYILKKIKKKKKLAAEIRLAKAFCYASDCYGAESYIRGFSGYALEVLVAYFGSFLSFVKKAATWQLPKSLETKIVIDPKKYYKNKARILHSMNESKLHAPIVLVDPVQKERNVTAALNYKTFERFVKACKAFKKAPSTNFFFKQKLNLSSLEKEAKKQKARLVTIKAISTKNKVDIAGAKLKKFYEYLFFLLKKNGFQILKGTFVFDETKMEARFYFILKQPSKDYLVGGPPTKLDGKYIKAFKKKWPRAFVKKGRLWAKAKRKIFDVKGLIKIISKIQLKEMGIKKLVVEK